MRSEAMNTPQTVRWHLYPTLSDLVERTTAAILRLAEDAIRGRGEFLLVLAGGTTPQRIYQQLARAAADWARWNIYFGDERCLDPDHPDRNSVMASMAWLAAAQRHGAQVFPIPAEKGPDEGAAAYRAVLQNVGTFDLVLLGLGEDGHTASLFPNHEWGQTDRDPTALAVHTAPKPPPARVSLSAARLSHARQVLVLVTGPSKVQAVAGWRTGAHLPITAIRPATGIDALLTNDAWG